MKVSTVLIDLDGNAVLINESDFDQKKHKLFGSKTAAPAKKKAASKKAK